MEHDLGRTLPVATPTRSARDVPDRLLRRAVLDHVSTERRRVFDPVLRVGRPGGRTAVLVHTRSGLDHALRVDAIQAMLRRVREEDAAEGITDDEPLVWLTRPGTLEVQDLDLEWVAATRWAGLELGIALVVVVVTRQGWCEPSTGASRTWRRLRPSR